MPVWVVTGKLGAGKTLVAVSRIQKYLNEGRRVATNLDLKLENMVNPFAKNTTVFRLPDIPTVESFEAIGQGYDGKMIGDHKNGLVVLDECALWLNSRDWNDKSRRKLIDYFVHLRKLRWDLLILIQDIEALDSQFRKLYAEHTVYCSRTDRFKIPLIGWLLQAAFGERVPLPRYHIGSVKYNQGTGQGTHIDTWVYRGTSLFSAYDTEQSFNKPDSPGLYSYLPPNTIRGRYVTKKQLIKDRLKSIGPLSFFFAGLLAGVGVVQAYTPDGNEPDRGNFTCNKDWKALFGDCDLSKDEVKQAYHDFKNKQKGGSDTAPPAASFEGVGGTEEPSPLNNIFITASIKFDSGQYEYLFKSPSGSFNPIANGYRVYDINECQATLIDVNDRKNRFDVFCAE